MKRCNFFGSFSPIHIGHLNQIKSLVDKGYIVDIIITPHNPHKDINHLLSLEFRIELCKISMVEYFNAEELTRIFIDDIEYTLPQPNYTYLTLRALYKKYGFEPILLMGTDLINKLSTWENYDEVKKYPIILADRPGYKLDRELRGKYNIIDKISTCDDVSSTEIMELLDSKPGEIIDRNYMTKKAFLKLYGN